MPFDIERSNRAEVRNPILALPAFQEVKALDLPVRQVLRRLILDLRDQMKAKADESLRKHKYMMYAYWKCGGVYAGHIARALA